jgi:hypothetical protein
MESWAWQFLRRNQEFREFWLTKVEPFMLADERVRSDWPHQEEMWSRFGIRRLQSPRQADCGWPPPFFTWTGPGPPRALWPPPYNTNSSITLEPSEYEMPVPLDDQFKAIEVHAKHYQRLLKKETAVRPKSARKSGRYSLYLRILDAENAGATRPAIENELFPRIPRTRDPDNRSKAFENARAEARRLRNFGYRTLALRAKKPMLQLLGP